ncbi:MAG: DUF4411 family protein [Spirochaetales bacterium]|jgi:hypothetical protein|nr:DUF4411 family protein [Spirochaetales bacterium]
MTARYCFDSNVFIRAKNFEYQFAIAPGFWDWIDRLFYNGLLICGHMVFEELHTKGDPLSDWVEKRERYFLDPENREQTAFTTITSLVISQYEEKRIRAFLDGADPWVIASAMANTLVVVSMEKRITNPERTSKIKIPNISDDFAVESISMYDCMVRTQAVLELKENEDDEFKLI